MERKSRGTGHGSKAHTDQTQGPPTRSERTITIHPRVPVEEDQMIKELAEQVNQPETTLWADCASFGLLILLTKKGPNALGMYGGRWNDKQLAQEIRRRIFNELIDFQYEQEELPGILRDYLATLKTLAGQRQQGILVPSVPPNQQEEISSTMEDEMIFHSQEPDVNSVNLSLAGMGFTMLNEGASNDEVTE